MPGPISDAGKQGQQLAQQIAKQMAREPFEVLSEAGKQVTGVASEQQSNQAPQAQTSPEGQSQAFVPNPNQPQIDLARIRELEGEVKQISDEKKAGEIRQDVQEEKQQIQIENVPQPLIEPTLKRKRGLFGMGPQRQAQKQQQRVERPMDPSG